MIKQILFTVLLSLSFTAYLTAQRALTGLWVGTLTQGENTYDVKMEMKKDGRKLSGSSLVILTDTSYIELHFNGLFHEDRSMNIYEVDILYPESPDIESEYFKRTYQLLYNRSFNDHFLEGWWHEMEKSATDNSRRFGRIQLKRVEDDSKA
ncbi:MAG: hypothetical protein KDC34_08880 [Saprospiraceae bacterium]|nr:hypothetical protein [Saprospiraceae bacterium]